MANELRAAESTFRCMISAYLVERDMEKTLSYLSEDLYSIGTGKNEIARTKAEFQELLRQELQLNPEPYSITLTDLILKPECGGTVSLFTGVVASRDLPNGQSMSLQIRITATLREEGDRYLISLLHASAPNILQEEQEFYPLSFGEKTLNELRDETQNKLTELVSNSIPGGMMGGYIEPGFPLYFVNDRMLEYLGYTYDEFVEATDGLVSNCMHPDDRAYVDSVVEASLKSGDEYEVKYRMLKKDGDSIWVMDKGRKIIAEDGRPAIISVCLDITQLLLLQQELAEKAEALEQNNAELEALTNNVPGGVCEISLDNRFTILYGNDAFFQLFGFAPDETDALFQNRFLALLHPDDSEHFYNTIHSAYRGGEKGFEFEGRFFHKSGAIIWILIRGTFSQNRGTPMMSCVIIDITNRKEAEQKLLLSEERFRVALTQTKNIIFDYDVSTKRISFSEGMARIHNLPLFVDNAPESLIEYGYIVKESANTFLDLFRKLACGEEISSCTVKVQQAGEFSWRKYSLTAIRDNKGQLVRAIGLSEDITKQKKTELLYFQGEQYRNAMLSESVLYCEIDFTHNRVETLRENSSGIFCPLDGIVLSSYDSFLTTLAEHAIYREDRQKFLDHFNRDSVLGAFQNGAREIKLEHRRLRKNGPPIWILSTMHLIWDISDETLKGFVYMENIDEEKKNVLTLQYKSERDSLTGLYNKLTTETLIREVLAEENRKKHAFLIVDVDNFKLINDNYGHMVGDQVLARIASKMQDLFRDYDILGRIGGDEFVVFMRELSKPETVLERAEALLDIFHQTILPALDGQRKRHHITCSIGISLYSHDGSSFEALYRNADIALYQAKDAGRDQFVFYHPNMAHLESRSDLGARTEIDSNLDDVPERCSPIKQPPYNK